MFDSRFNNFSRGVPNINGATRSTDAESQPSLPTDMSAYSSLTLDNPFAAVSSSSCVFTLGILTKEQVAFPDATYRAGEAFRTILRSGGTGDTRVRTQN